MPSKIRCFKLIVLCLLVSSFTVLIFNAKLDQNNLHDFVSKCSNKPSDLSSRYNFIFIETKADREFFDLKQLCAIESAAFTNPLADVYVFSLNAKFNQTDFLERYPNVRLVPYAFDSLFSSSFFGTWWKNNKDLIFESMYAIQDLSDLVRLYLLWLNGGIYSDLDTITIRSFQPLLNYTGIGLLNLTDYIDYYEFTNGIMIFPAGHRILLETINGFQEKYQPNVWAANGPRLLETTIKTYCNISDLFTDNLFDPLNEFGAEANSNLTKSECDIKLFPYTYFYPYDWLNVDKIFEPNYNIPVPLFTNTYSIHMYGHLTLDRHYKRNVHSIHEFFSKLYCPFSFSQVAE